VARALDGIRALDAPRAVEQPVQSIGGEVAGGQKATVELPNQQTRRATTIELRDRFRRLDAEDREAAARGALEIIADRRVFLVREIPDGCHAGARRGPRRASRSPALEALRAPTPSV